MPKAKIVNHTSAQLNAMRGKDRTDWARVRSMSDVELTSNAKSDPDNQPLTKKDFSRAQVVMRGRPVKPTDERKQPVTIRLSPDVLAYYRSLGRGWQGRIDADLKKRAKAASAHGH